jgi:asparagine synthase (glutamine-hydrolysing)
MGTDDVTALAQFLTFLWIPDPATPYSGARSLEPGSVLRWHEGECQMWAFEDFLSIGQRDLSLREASEEAEGIVRSAVQRQLLSDVPVGLMASGGVDSSLIWWAADDAIGRAFTIDWSGDIGAELVAEDTTAVRGLERRLGTPTDYLPGPTIDVDELPSSGDLFADPAYHLARVIARDARERGFKVLLSGQGADELFGGYRRHLFAPFLEHLGLGRAGTLGASLLTRGLGNRLGSEYAARVLRAAAQPDAFSRYMELCSYSTAPERARALDCTEREVSDDVVWARHREVYDRLPVSWSVLRRALALDLTVYLPGLGLAYCDRAGMEFGVEIRVPWLDLELARWALALPDHCLVRGRQSKRATRALAESVLGGGIARRPKRGFGIPTRQLDTREVHEVGHRGFRQGRYFSHARRLLAAHLARTSLGDR